MNELEFEIKEVRRGEEIVYHVFRKGLFRGVLILTPPYNNMILERNTMTIAREKNA